MSAWKELPKPATPGPWRVREAVPWDVLTAWEEHDPVPRGHLIVCEHAGPDAAAIAALPEWIEEAERLRAWVDWLEQEAHVYGLGNPPITMDGLRAGEWPEGSKP